MGKDPTKTKADPIARVQAKLDKAAAVYDERKDGDDAAKRRLAHKKLKRAQRRLAGLQKAAARAAGKDAKKE